MHPRYTSNTLLLLALAVAFGGCDSLLEVDNPNDVTEDEIRNDRAATAWADGALWAVQEGWDWTLINYANASDQIRAVGTWPGVHGLDRGHLDELSNELFDPAYLKLAQGRWMADEAIFVLDSLATAGDLSDSTLLARSYFYGAIAYAIIADWMDDFTFSDRMDAGPAVGPENMRDLYDTAITYLANALAIDNSSPFSRNVLAFRARARYAAAMWDMIGEVPIDLGASNGLVSEASAAQDASSALNEDASDWRYQFDFTSPNDGSELAWRFNHWWNPSFRFGERYVVGDRGAASVVLLDPIDGIPDPWLENFTLGEIFAPGAIGNFYFEMTVFSAREMRLIIAEDALARGDTTTFATEINAIRSYDGLTDWSTASPVSALDMLIYQRRVNLFCQGRRLHDMYRFGIKSDNWETHSVAYTTPGTFFPIPKSEIDANCHLNPEVECLQ
jgi:hypothetical protein